MRHTGYYHTDMNVWKGRTDHTSDRDHFRFHQIIKPLNLTEALPDVSRKSFCLLGFASDEGVKRNMGRQGAVDAPQAIRQAMVSLPWQWDDVCIYDAGDVVCADGELEKAEVELSAAVDKICRAGAFPIVLGGGHEVALGHYNGLKRYYKDKTFGIINFDAHFDIRTAEKMSSGTMFSQIAETEEDFRYFCLGIQKSGNTRTLFEKAEKLGVKYYTAEEIDKNRDYAELIKFMDESDRIYMTLCFDVISSAFAPGVSAPQPFGLDPKDVRKLMGEILSTGKVAGFDIAEVSPKLDSDSRTSKLAAHLIYYLIDELSMRL